MNRHFPSASRQPKPRSNLRDRARSEPASLDAPMDRRERCRCGSAQPREGEVYFHQCLVTSGIQIFCGEIFPNHQPLSRPSSGRQQPQVQVHSTTSAPYDSRMLIVNRFDLMISRIDYALLWIFFFRFLFHFLILGSCHFMIPVQKTSLDTIALARARSLDYRNWHF